MKERDVAYLIASDVGFWGWGYLQKMRATNEGKTYIELPFNVVQQNILSNAEINNYPELLEMRKRITGNTVKLSRKEIKVINKILKEKGLDAPKAELRLGKFGVKDDETLSDDLADMISECDSVTVAFADLDNFSEVNNNNDHFIGDQVIRSALEIFNGCLDSKGDLFHRSGDEMVALLPNMSKTEAICICDNFRKRLEGFEFPGIGKGLVTTTIGLASFPEDGDNGIDLIRLADQRAMSGKKKKRNTIYFE